MNRSVAKSSVTPSYNPLSVVISAWPPVDVANEDAFPSWKSDTTGLPPDRVLEPKHAHDPTQETTMTFTRSYAGESINGIDSPSCADRNGIAAYDTIEKGSVLGSLTGESFDLAPEFLSVLEELVHTDLFFEDVKELGVVGSTLHELPADAPLFHVELLLPLLRERLVAPHTRRLFARRLSIAPRALDGADRVGFVLGDIKTADARQLAVGVIREDGDVATGDTRPARPAVVFFDVSLVHAAAGEVCSTGLPEVGEGDGPIDAGTLGGGFECLLEHPEGEFVGAREFAPQRCVAVIGRGVVGEPLLEVRDARDERDGALAGLAVDGDLKAVIVVGDVADGEATDLATPSAGVPRDGDESRIARVARPLNHREDMLVPVEHVARLGRRVVVARGLATHPIDGVGRVVAFGDALAEDTEGDAIVPVGLLVVVLTIDPADDAFGRLAIVERVGEAADFLSHDRAVTEEFLMSMIGILSPTESEFVGESKQDFAVGIRNFAVGFDTIPQSHDFGGWIGGHGEGCGEGKDKTPIRGSEPFVPSRWRDQYQWSKALSDTRPPVGGIA